MYLTEKKMKKLLMNCIDKIVDFEDEYADDVLLDAGFDYQTLFELGYRMNTFTVEELSDGALEKALADTLEADFGGKMECDGQPITREDLIEYNLMADIRYTCTGRFVDYGEYIRNFEEKYWNTSNLHEGA
jgi:hypothetical protein